MKHLHSESSKTDKEIMWEKLSTLPDPNPIDDMRIFQGQLYKAFGLGELTVYAAGRNVGKSKFRG